MKIKKSVIRNIHESAQLIRSLEAGKNYGVLHDYGTEHSSLKRTSAVEMAKFYAEHICDQIDQNVDADFYDTEMHETPMLDKPLSDELEQAPNIPSVDELEGTVASLYQAMADIRNGLVKGSRQGDDPSNIVDTAIDLLNLQLSDLGNDDLGTSAIEEADNAQ